MRVVLLTCVAAPLLRVALYYGFPEWRSLILYSFPTVADAIGVGCVLAGARANLGRMPIYRSVQNSSWFVLVPLALVTQQVALFHHPLFRHGIGQSLQNVGIALSLDWVLSHPESRVGRLLQLPLITRVGVLSYSIYLWQQLFLNPHSSGWLQSFPQNVILTFTVAAASYHLIERPFLTLRARLDRRIWPRQRLARLTVHPIP